VQRSVILAAFAVCLLAAQAAFAQSTAPGAVTVFTARKIVTMDPGWPEATAVAVQDGRILSVGTLDDLQPWLRRFPHTIDRRFEQSVLYPGFVEPHSHPLIGGTSLTRPPLTFFPTPNPWGPAFPGVKDKAAAFAKLAEYVAADPTDEVLVSWGYDVVAMGGYIDLAELDAVSATKPILVWDASEHFVFGNSAALRKLGLTPALAKQVPGIGLTPDGALNGQFLGERAAQAVCRCRACSIRRSRAAT
jgi:predicted amidohydrolase YtcJ